MIYSPERKNSNQNNKSVVTFTKFNLIRRLLTLFVPILLHHVRLVWSSSSFPMLSLPLLGIDYLSFPLSGGPGPPSLPSPTLTPFPSDPRQQPVSTLGTWEWNIIAIAVPVRGQENFFQIKMQSLRC
jgi:hypothetical protein